MPILSESIQYSPIRALVYGTTGSAKTTLWGLMSRYEEFRPIYCMDFDLRIASLEARLSQEDFKYIYYDEYRDGVIPGGAFNSTRPLMNNPTMLDEKYKVQFKTIAIDSATFMGKSIMSSVLAADGKNPGSTPQLQHYMQAMSLTEEFVSKICARKCNIIYTCHEDTQKDEVTGRLFKNVDLTGKLANRIPGYFNELWHTEVRPKPGADPEFVVRCRSDATYQARTTFRDLANVELQEDLWPKVVAAMKKRLVASPGASSAA